MIADTPTRFKIGSVYKPQIDPILWDRLVRRIMTDSEFQRQFGHEAPNAQHRWAERILDQAIAFLHLLADTGGSYSPSRLVDIGWHTFLLYTREYAEFCQRVFGRFIHHSPNDIPGHVVGSDTSTVAAMRVRRLPVHEDLWAGSTNWCGEPPAPLPPEPPSIGCCVPEPAGA